MDGVHVCRGAAAEQLRRRSDLHAPDDRRARRRFRRRRSLLHTRARGRSGVRQLPRPDHARRCSSDISPPPAFPFSGTPSALVRRLDSLVFVCAPYSVRSVRGEPAFCSRSERPSPTFGPDRRDKFQFPVRKAPRIVPRASAAASGRVTGHRTGVRERADVARARVFDFCPSFDPLTADRWSLCDSAVALAFVSLCQLESDQVTLRAPTETVRSAELRVSDERLGLTIEDDRAPAVSVFV